jgi:hypothetical protein
MGNENGFEFTPKEGGIGMPNQETSPSVPFSTGDKMRRGAQPQIFDNNGGTSKGDGGGTINKNGEYGPITTGF